VKPPAEVRALTIHQPCASPIAHRSKVYETRPWKTTCREPVAIHAAKAEPSTRDSRHAYKLLGGRVRGPVPRGRIIAITDHVDCVPANLVRDGRVKPVDVRLNEFEIGNFELGRWGVGTDERVAATEPRRERRPATCLAHPQ
jgi:hypothetical protein